MCVCVCACVRACVRACVCVCVCVCLLLQSMDIRARGKNLSVVRIMWLFVFFIQSKYANKKMASNSVVIVSIVYAVWFVINYSKYYFQVMLQLSSLDFNPYTIIFPVRKLT